MMVTIRPYSRADAVAVGVLVADTFGRFNLASVAPEERDAFLGPFRHARSTDQAHRTAIHEVIRAEWVIVAQSVGEIVGLLRGKPGRLQSLFVRGDHQREGIGRRLVQQFEDRCLQSGAPAVRLMATLEAVPFYHRMGYRKSTGIRSSRIFDGEGFRYQPMKKALACSGARVARESSKQE